MFFRNVLLLSGLAAVVLSDPIPQFGNDPLSDLGGDPFTDIGDPFTDLGGDPFTDIGDPYTDLGGDPLTGLGSITDGGSYPSGLGQPSTGGLPSGLAGPTTSAGGSDPTNNPFAGMSTLPASLEAVIATAVPASVLSSALANPCELTGTPAWVKSLPTDVQSPLLAYESSVLAWYSANSATVSGRAGLCKNGASNTAAGGSGNPGQRSTGAAPVPLAPSALVLLALLVYWVSWLLC
jgi:hypothetical protein